MNFAVDDGDDDRQTLENRESADNKVVVILSRTIDEGFIDHNNRATEDFVFLADDGDIISIAKGTEYIEIEYQLRRLTPKQLECVTIHDDRRSAIEHHNTIERMENEYAAPSSTATEQPNPVTNGPNPHIQTITDFMTDDMCKIFSGTSPLSTLNQDVTIAASGGFEIKFFRHTARYKVLRILSEASREHPTMSWDMLYYLAHDAGREEQVG